MAGKIIYQIKAEGYLKCFDGKKTYSSRKVFVNTPSESDVEEFIDSCCDSPDGNNFFDLDRKGLKTFIVELTLIE